MALPRTILVPIDFSDCSEAALDHAVDLAAKLDARVHVVHVVYVPSFGGVDISALMIDSAFASSRKALEHLVVVRSGRCAFGPVRVETGDAREFIGAVAEDLHADLIVMGTHGRRGLKRFVLGSVAESVARHAPCPVMLVPARS